ncbi:ankyrin repeat-containing domain protein [Rhodocollybia butyracea]|uniref:Ankyrin repeat-containing domain protein n=1 Tax=Rhodocollybia butyracea TaxID=206335 RepID=A0A9P5PCW2_9AGAR|nr:ankyrin repeat-containing domain protein [Rhodocollybia butyracea]
MYEPSSSRDPREQQVSPQAGTDRPGNMFANASNFTLVNPKFQAATTIINHPTGSTEPIRKWLKAPDPSTNFVAACDKRTPGTGDWIFSHPEFVKWSQGTPGLLWIQGKVGSGKTFLLAAIVQKLKADPGLLCCYYYFDNRDNSQIKTNARGLLKSLLLQMATRDEGIHHGQNLSPVYLVLDAMDVFKHLSHLRENLYMAVTSRYLAEASYGSTESIHLEVDFARSGFDQDVAQYIRDKLSYRKLNPELFTEIVDHLTQGAHGQFRWVDCQVTVLQRCVMPKAIKDALDKLPKTLEGTYTVAIGRLKKSEHLHDGVQLLMWLAYAFRPLSIEEVTDILAVDLDAQIFDPAARSLELETGIYDILDSTPITVDAKKIVQLAHNSVKEYLTQIKGQSQLSELIEINEHLANSTICQACLIYLLHLDSQGILPKYKQTLRELYPLALYASKGWASHMKRLDEAVPEHKPAKDLAITFLKDSSQLTYMNWIRIHNIDQEYSWERYNPTLGASEIQTPLYYMACLGLLSIAKHLLVENMADVNAKGGRYGTALMAAIRWENKDIIQLLLEHKADAAASEGNKDLVQLLLKYKADINALGRPYGTALHDVNAQGGKYGNTLQAAARRGNQHIVQLLLEYKADVNAPGGEYGSALQAASWRGNKRTVQLLLEHKADVNDQGGKYGTALQAATCWGDQHVVQLLLETNPNAKTQVPRIGNALLTAISNAQYMNLNEVDFLKIFDMGNVRSLELCVYEGGVHAQVKNLIHTAIRNRNKDIVQHLLEHNANVNVQGGRYGNALQAAIRKGNKDIVQLLLEYKADVNVQKGEYGGALHVATDRGNKDIVQLLLEHKAEVNAPVERFGSALQIAVVRENKDIVQLLLEHKADVNAQGGKYGNALQAAARWGNLHIVQLLLEHKADLNAQGGWYGNALCAAVSGPNNDILQLLLTHQAKNAHRACETALQSAVNVEHIVQISDS